MESEREREKQQQQPESGDIRAPQMGALKLELDKALNQKERALGREITNRAASFPIARLAL